MSRNTLPIRVEKLSFRRSGPQVWRDGWRGTDRIMRFDGCCVACGRRTYSFDDGENDPRGALGDHANSSLGASDYGAVGPDVPACFCCMNEEHSYSYALEIARKRWARHARKLEGMVSP